MNVSAILSKAYRLTNKNSNTFMDGNTANVLAELNICYGQRVLDILRVRQDLNQFITEQKTDLISTAGLLEGNIGFNGEYPFSTNILRPLRIEISYDGLTWNKAKIYDLNDSGQSEHDEDDINSAFSESEPYVRFERNSYFIRPLKTSVADVSNGIHVWWEERQSSLTNLSPDFEANLHDILSYDMANLERIMHPDKYAITWRNDFDMTYARVEARFDEFYKNQMKKNFVMRAKLESYK